MIAVFYHLKDRSRAMRATSEKLGVIDIFVHRYFGENAGI